MSVPKSIVIGTDQTMVDFQVSGRTGIFWFRFRFGFGGTMQLSLAAERGTCPQAEPTRAGVVRTLELARQPNIASQLQHCVGLGEAKKHVKGLGGLFDATKTGWSCTAQQK